MVLFGVRFGKAVGSYKGFDIQVHRNVRQTRKFGLKKLEPREPRSMELY